MEMMVWWLFANDSFTVDEGEVQPNQPNRISFNIPVKAGDGNSIIHSPTANQTYKRLTLTREVLLPTKAQVTGM
jgi:hypothetical protein